MLHRYETQGAEIYRQSFATIRREAELSRFTAVEERVVVRMIHAAGMVELAPLVAFSPGMADAARQALQDGAPVLCDVRMVSEGITRTRLPARNPIVCTLQDSQVPALAQQLGTTRSAAAVELWRPQLQGAVVAIGNAPTALFRLLEHDVAVNGVIGVPVGFVGAAESKEALTQSGLPGIAALGRKGGSNVAAAIVNAILYHLQGAR